MNPLTATRRAGKIDEGRFLQDAMCDATDALSIKERDRFMDFAMQNIFSLTLDMNELDRPASGWTRLTQALAKAAASVGQGVNDPRNQRPLRGATPRTMMGAKSA